MIERVLWTGEVIEFDDNTSPEEIEAALRQYLAETIQRPSTPPSDAVSPEPSPAPEPEPAPPALELEPAPEPLVVPMRRRLIIEPYTPDENETELLRRLGRPARSVDPPPDDDPFRDNLHSRWSVRRWPR